MTILGLAGIQGEVHSGLVAKDGSSKVTSASQLKPSKGHCLTMMVTDDKKSAVLLTGDEGECFKSRTWLTLSIPGSAATVG
jgi:hypothetical protein